MSGATEERNMTGGQSAARMNDRHSFPVGGLVDLSRAT